MSLYYVVKVDVSKKQEYIFSSNRIKDIIGASLIIEFITANLGKEILNKMGLPTGSFIIDKKFNEGSVLLEAGGNSLYVFKEKKIAEDFNKNFSNYVLKNFDGIKLVLAIQEFDFTKNYAWDLFSDGELDRKIMRKKRSGYIDAKTIGFGMNVICPNTHKPAGYEIMEISDDDQSKSISKLVSKEVFDKRRFFDCFFGKDEEKNSKFNRHFGDNNKNYNKGELSGSLTKLFKENGEFIERKFNDLGGSKHGGSFIGITCIDGNGMGDRFRNIKDSHVEKMRKTLNNLIETLNGDEKNFAIKYYELLDKRNSIDYRNHNIKSLSMAIEQRNLDYLSEYIFTADGVREIFEESFVQLTRETNENIQYEKNRNKARKIPDTVIIPIILAGDDVTFVTHGKLSIDISKRYIEILDEKVKKHDIEEGCLKGITLSAGVAIIKSNFPFSVAIKIANDLESECKKLVAYQKKEEKYSAIDWQICRGDISEKLSAMRDGVKVARPYFINSKNIENKIDFSRFDNMFSLINDESNGKLNEYFRNENDNDLKAYVYKNEFKIKNSKDNDEVEKILYDAIEAINLYEKLGGEVN